MILTLEQLKKIYPKNKECELWLPLFNKLLPQYNMGSRERTIMFLAQISIESIQLTKLEENLYYTTPERVAMVFRTRFDLNKNKKIEQSEIEYAKAYIRNPQKLANAVYANKMENGNELSGDGWLYRGQGPIQTTGKANFKAFAVFMKISLEDTMRLIKTKEGAVLSGIFYFVDNQINSFSDAKDIRGATKRINTALVGIEDRISEYNRIATII